MALDDYLRKRARDGLAERMAVLYPDEKIRAEKYPEYSARLELELDTIIQMGFPGYFLIVSDFIIWGKHNGVPVGPGRGSGAGSLVAYAIGITDLDPLAYALLFERFLNPERVSMPDFDVDFCQDNRWRVIEYVREKYGADAVSQIATFGAMAARAVIRDVGRVLDLSYNFCDQLSKMIPSAPGKNVTLDEALEQVPELKARYESEEEVKELFDLARKLEGLTRNVGMHAGGVLIAPGKLTDFCPLYNAEGSDSVVSQFDKDDVEKVGLVKFDFLGLRNLTIIDLAVKYIKLLDPTWDVNLETLPLDDPAAYDIFKTANTTAIFQVESEGMKKLLVKLAPDRFEDIVAVLALYRPGPLGSGMVDDFILRKKGKQTIDYFHPDLKECLEPTYGVIVYQEQVMQISQIIGGYSLGGADLLRRAMGKKKAEEMAKHRDIMREGAKKKGYDEALAMQLFDLMEKFAEYGFNKSHTAAYAVVSYQTAWLKAHHTAAYMAATLSSDMDDTDSVKIFIEDALKNRLTILPPDINQSVYRFLPVDRKQVRYGLGAVKGTGEGAVVNILAARESGGAEGSSSATCSTSAPHRPARGQPPRHRSPGQGRRLRQPASQPQRHPHERGPGHGMGGKPAGQRRPELPVRRRDRGNPAGPDQGAGVGPEGTPGPGKDRPGLLSVRPSLRGRQGFAEGPGGSLPEGRQAPARPATHGRHRLRRAHPDDAPGQDGRRHPGRRPGPGGSGGVQRAVRSPPHPDQGRRPADHHRQGQFRCLLGRHARHRRRGHGPGRRPYPLRHPPEAGAG
jgi:DNA polymerase-3 subunit alpha